MSTQAALLDGTTVLVLSNRGGVFLCHSDVK